MQNEFHRWPGIKAHIPGAKKKFSAKFTEQTLSILKPDRFSPIYKAGDAEFFPGLYPILNIRL